MAGIEIDLSDEPMGDGEKPARALVEDTDLGNARRLVLSHGQDLRFCHPWQRWLVWDGSRWVNDDTGESIRRAKGTVQAILAEAAAEDDDSRRKELAKHALRSQGERPIRAMLALAQSEPGIPVIPAALDADPWALNCLNGTLDLRNRTLRPHTRDDLITKAVPIAYDEAATCPTWQAALDTWLGGDPELLAYVQRLVGYSLAGTNREQIILILYGPGANGKSTFLSTVLELAGDYWIQTPQSTFLERRGDTIPNDLAALRGVRLVSTAETGESRRLNEALVKQATGGDRITARFMRGEWFEFVPAFTPWLATNHKPEIRGTDEGVWRRIRLIPFTQTIPEQNRDQELTEKLRAELAGILAWAVQGCEDWFVDGLDAPEAVTDATADYRTEMDVVGRFIEDACVLHPDAKTKAGDLYNRFGYWAAANGERDTLTAKAFGQRLAGRGLKQHRTGDARWWLEIGIRHNEGHDA